MRIQNNMMALNTYRQYNIANNQTAGYAEKLSSGYQINRAGDDAAGLAISEKMRAQIRGLNMASKNSLDAVSLIQTAEGALQSTHDILQRMRELAVQSASDTNEQIIDRGALDQEFQALKAEIDDTARTTRFNDQNLIDGTFQKAFYSTDITNSKLTIGTTADVSRVGVKSSYKQDGTYKINVKYIETQNVQYATASSVSVSGAKGIGLASDPHNSTSAIRDAKFDAVVGSQHNGKTFTISASGSGQELFDGTNGLQVSITDGDTVYEGTVIATNMIEGGSQIQISFEGVGTLTLDLRNDENYINGDSTIKNVYNISSMLNGKEIKFLKSPEVVGSASVFTTPETYAGETKEYSATAATLSTGVTHSNDATAGGTINIDATAITVAVGASGTNNTSATAATGTFNYTIGNTTYTATWDLTGGVNLDLDTGINLAGSSITVDMGTHGTFTIDGATQTNLVAVAGGGGGTNTAADAAIKAALQSLSGTVLEISAGRDEYDISATYDLATGDKYRNASVAITTAPTGTLIDANGVLDLAGLEFTVTLEDGVTTETYSLTDGNLSATLTQLGGGAFDVDKAQVLTLNLSGFGTFTYNIGDSEGRSLAGNPTTLSEDVETLFATDANFMQLGLIREGTDTIDSTVKEIALTLKGEVVVVGLNDKVATFDQSGIKLTFDALDMSTVNNDATATAKFTSNTGIGNQIHIYVSQNEGKALTIQTGANQGDELDINIDAMNCTLLGIADSSIATQKSASRAITEVNNAINQVSTQRAALGALQNRLNFKIANLDTSAENLQAAESRIRDTDMAKVMTAFTKSNILGQAATAMLAQANSQPQNVLQLLR